MTALHVNIVVRTTMQVVWFVRRWVLIHLPSMFIQSIIEMTNNMMPHTLKANNVILFLTTLKVLLWCC